MQWPKYQRRIYDWNVHYTWHLYLTKWPLYVRNCWVVRNKGQTAWQIRTLVALFDASSLMFQACCIKCLICTRDRVWPSYVWIDCKYSRLLDKSKLFKLILLIDTACTACTETQMNTCVTVSSMSKAETIYFLPSRRRKMVWRNSDLQKISQPMTFETAVFRLVEVCMSKLVKVSSYRRTNGALE